MLNAFSCTMKISTKLLIWIDYKNTAIRVKILCTSLLHKDSTVHRRKKKRTIINIPVGKPIYYIRTRQSRAVDLLSGVDETDRSILWNKLTFPLAPLYISPFWIRIIPRRGMRLSNISSRNLVFLLILPASNGS